MNCIALINYSFYSQSQPGTSFNVTCLILYNLYRIEHVTDQFFFLLRLSAFHLPISPNITCLILYNFKFVQNKARDTQVNSGHVDSRNYSAT